MAETVAPGEVDSQGDELAGLDDLAAVVRENARDEGVLARRIGQLRAGRAKGRSWRELLAREQRPGALELAARILRRLTEASGTLRRTVANGLRAEGTTISAIAAVFGVSHQRVSALLRRDSKRPPV
jgi:hypothetical protein